MRLHSAYFTSVLGGAAAALCFAVTLAMPAIIQSFPGPKPAVAETAMPDMVVERAFKGDRLPISVRPADAKAFEVPAPAGTSPKLLDGCESAFSPMDQSSAAKLARSCTT